MYELHGWINIRESYLNIDDNKNNKDNIIKMIKNKISSYKWNNEFLNMQIINGEFFITATINTNHKRQDAVDIMNLYEYIAKIAPGSYGILYIYDDEDVDGFDNEFQVYVLTKGTIKKHKDIYLSPFIPIVEDQYND